jgi:hypothetical protein
VKENHYTSFVDKYSNHHELGVNGQQCFRLRCGLIHRGNARGYSLFDANYVVFTVPETGVIAHAFTLLNPIGASAVIIDLPTFCAAMAKAVERWFLDNQSDPTIEGHAQELLSLRPEGVAPFIVGRPVIASGAP